MKLIFLIFFILFMVKGYGQIRDTTIILSDSEALDYIHNGYKLRTEFNPVTQRYVCVIDVILTSMPLFIDTITLKSKRLLKRKRINLIEGDTGNFPKPITIETHPTNNL